MWHSEVVRKRLDADVVGVALADLPGPRIDPRLTSTPTHTVAMGASASSDAMGSPQREKGTPQTKSGEGLDKRARAVELI